MIVTSGAFDAMINPGLKRMPLPHPHNPPHA